LAAAVDFDLSSAVWAVAMRIILPVTVQE